METGNELSLQESQGSSIPAKVTVGESNAIQQLIEQTLGGKQAVSLHNFMGDAMTVWRMVAKCEGPDTVNLDQWGDKPIIMVHFYAHKVELMDLKTGELSEVTRVVLVDNEGHLIKFVSDGIAKSLGKLIQAFGIGPWPSGIPVKVQVVNTRAGWEMYTLVPAE